MFTKIFISILVLILSQEQSHGALHGSTKKMIDEANKNGPYLGLVIPNMFEMNPLLNNPHYKSTKLIIDYAGRRFRFGKIYKKPVILVMSGMGLVNAAVVTQLLLTLFEIEGVVHYGIAGNANPNLNIGDVTIAEYWSHSALWNWQRYGDGPENELPFEGEDGFTRDIGYLKFGAYAPNGEDNLLNNVWYQAEEVYPVDGTPELPTHKIMWVATIFMASAYIAATWAILPQDQGSRWLMIELILVGVGCTLVVLLGLSILLGKQWSRKREWRRRKEKKMTDGTPNSSVNSRVGEMHFVNNAHESSSNSDVDSSDNGYQVY